MHAAPPRGACAHKNNGVMPVGIWRIPPIFILAPTLVLCMMVWCALHTPTSYYSEPMACKGQHHTHSSALAFERQCLWWRNTIEIAPQISQQKRCTGVRNQRIAKLTVTNNRQYSVRMHKWIRRVCVGVCTCMIIDLHLTLCRSMMCDNAVGCPHLLCACVRQHAAPDPYIATQNAIAH